MRYRRVTERPPNPRLKGGTWVSRGLVFANIGGGAKTPRYLDASGHGNHGALTGYTGAHNTPVDRWGRALGRACLGTNASSDYIAVASITQAAHPVPFSASCWFRFPVDPGAYYVSTIYSHVLADNPMPGWTFGAGNDNFLHWTIPVFNSGPTIAFSKGDRGWHHVAGTYDGSTARFYLDGIPGTPATVAFSPQNTTLKLMMGKYYASPSVADPCLWSRILSPAEIARLADPAWSVTMGGAIYTRPRRSFVGQVGGEPPAGNRRRRILLLAGAW